MLNYIHLIYTLHCYQLIIYHTLQHFFKSENIAEHTLIFSNNQFYDKNTNVHAKSYILKTVSIR